MHPRVHLWEFTYRDDDPIYCFTTFMAAKEHHKNKRPNSRSWRPSAAMIFICRAATCYGGMNWTTRASSPTVSWPFSTKKQSLSDKLWKTICWLILLKYWLFLSIEIKYGKRLGLTSSMLCLWKVSEHWTPPGPRKERIRECRRWGKPCQLHPSLGVFLISCRCSWEVLGPHL